MPTLTFHQEQRILQHRIADARRASRAAESRRDWHAAHEAELELQHLQRRLDAMVDDALLAIPRHQRAN